MYRSQYELGEVALYVNDINLSRDFYQSILGMELLGETKSDSILGVNGKPLVHLKQSLSDKQDLNHYHGLYHMAILLPTQDDLANLFKRLVDLELPLSGGADHGYSQAIYFNDVEGNGIEIYYDKPVEEWDIKDDGKIIGVTEELDTQLLYSKAKKMKHYLLPSNTRMGHVHLSVKNAKNSSLLYQKLLGMTEKFGMASASWIASGTYHHHLALNEWQKHVTREGKQMALAYFTLHATNKQSLLEIAKLAQEHSLNIEWKNSYELFVQDFDGITCRIIVN